MKEPKEKLIFFVIYIFSIEYTKSVGDSQFMYRAWGWTEYFICICSVGLIIKKYKHFSKNLAMWLTLLVMIGYGKKVYESET